MSRVVSRGMKKYFLILLLLCGCGTETGNPINSGEFSSGTNEDTVYFSNTLAETICNKLIACFSDITDLTSCKEEIENETGFDSALSLGSSYSSLELILEAEKTSKIALNSTESAQCKTDIENLNCSDSEVINAYDSSSPSDYSQVANIIPVNAGSCQDAFNEN